MSRNRRVDSRRLREKGVIAIGKNIGRRGTNGKIIVGAEKTETKKKPRVLAKVTDLPAEVRTKVDGIRKKYRNWGPQKNSVAARSIIAACGKNKALVNIVMVTMLRKPMHQQLTNTIRKQMKAYL